MFDLDGTLVDSHSQAPISPVVTLLTSLVDLGVICIIVTAQPSNMREKVMQTLARILPSDIVDKLILCCLPLEYMGWPILSSPGEVSQKEKRRLCLQQSKCVSLYKQSCRWMANQHRGLGPLLMAVGDTEWDFQVPPPRPGATCDKTFDLETLAWGESSNPYEAQLLFLKVPSFTHQPPVSVHLWNTLSSSIPHENISGDLVFKWLPDGQFRLYARLFVLFTESHVAVEREVIVTMDTDPDHPNKEIARLPVHFVKKRDRCKVILKAKCTLGLPCSSPLGRTIRLLSESPPGEIARGVVGIGT